MATVTKPEKPHGELAAVGDSERTLPMTFVLSAETMHPHGPRWFEWAVLGAIACAMVLVAR